MSALAMSVPTDEFSEQRSANGVSGTSEALLQHWLQARRHFLAPVSRESVARKVFELAATWREERGPFSSIADLVLSPSYQRIIGLGPKAVPFILLELAQRPDHWFWALSAITGANPIPSESAGSLPAMTSAWIQWGEEQGQID